MRRSRHVIVLNDHAYISGGAAKVALTSAAGLAKAGYQVTLFTGSGPVWPELEASGVEVVCLNQTDLAGEKDPVRAASRGLWNREVAHSLEALISRAALSNSIIHLHGWAKSLSPSIGPVLRRSGIPVVATIHEYFIACPNGAFYDYRREQNCDVRPLSPACLARNCDARAWSHKGWRLARQILLQTIGDLEGAFAGVITLSDLQRRVLGPYLSGRARSHVVENPVDVADNGAAPVEESNEFIFVGRISPEKGARDFARAARRLGLAAVFVGDGPDRAALQTAYPEFEYIGWLEPQRVSNRMRNARALVFPSRWHECQPLTTLEALANGVPVISSENCAAAEQITPGKTGLLFEGGDVESLTQALQAMTPTEARRMGLNAYRDYWAEPLTLDRHLVKLEAVYAAHGL